MKADQERVSKLLTDTVTLLCKNGLIYSQEIKVQGLLGITLDKNDVFIVHINETIGGGTSKEASPAEGSRRKTVAAPAGGALNYVDLTRLTDTPMVSLNSMQEMSMMQGGRKQRPSSMMPPQMSPHMMARGGMQYMSPGMHPPRGMRMNNAAMHSAQQMGNHMMYTPRGGGPPMMMPNMRGYTGGRGGGMGSRPRHTVQMIPSAVAAMNDDEDVMIVGTGHEDPNWKNNAMRRPPNLQAQQVPQPRRRLVQNPPMLNAPNRHMSNVAQAMSSSQIVRNQSTPNGIGATSSKSNKNISQIIVDDNGSPSAQIIIQPTESAADRGDGDEAGVSGYQPEFVLLNSIGGVSFDGGVEEGSLSGGDVGTRKEMDGGRVDEPTPTMIYTNVSASGSGDDVSSILPVVYTDIADPPTNASLSSNQDESVDMNIETPGFDILTADDDNFTASSDHFPSDGGFDTWTCRFADCNATFTSAAHLANHYTLQHSAAVDIAAPAGTVMPLAVAQPGSSTSSGSSGKGHRSSVRQKEVCCPFDGCPALFSSYPGLYMHHKRVHGAPISKDVRRVLRKRYGMKRGVRCVSAVAPNEVDHVQPPAAEDVENLQCSPGDVDENPQCSPGEDDNEVAIGGDVEDGGADEGEMGSEVGGGSPTKNFLCLFSECEASCTSREKLVEHLQSCHGSMDAMVAEEVDMKEEEN